MPNAQRLTPLLKQELEASIRSLRSKYTALQDTHADLEDANSALQRSSSSTIATQKGTISTLERKVALLEEDLARTRDLAQQNKDVTRTLRDQLERLELERDAPISRREDVDNWSVVREELNRQSIKTRVQLKQLTNLKARRPTGKCWSRKMPN